MSSKVFSQGKRRRLKLLPSSQAGPSFSIERPPSYSKLVIDVEKFIVNHNKQKQSPLFNQIPPEVRNTIFLYALLSYEDLGTLYPSNDHYSRPEYRHASHIDPRLLQTCRLVYLETRFLPVMADEHVFWCDRAPPGLKYANNPSLYFQRFTEEQMDHIDRIHFFTQQYYLEDTFPAACRLPNIRPRSLKITLRHGDWWYWEKNNPLRLKDGWASGFRNSKRLEEVILELETMERDKDQVSCLCWLPQNYQFIVFQIYAIANRVSKETYPLHDSRILSAAGHPLVKREWMGPSRLENLRFDKDRNRWVRRNRLEEQYFPDPGLKYCIVLIKWTAVAAAQ